MFARRPVATSIWLPVTVCPSASVTVILPALPLTLAASQPVSNFTPSSTQSGQRPARRRHGRRGSAAAWAQSR